MGLLFVLLGALGLGAIMVDSDDESDSSDSSSGSSPTPDNTPDDGVERTEFADIVRGGQGTLSQGSEEDDIIRGDGLFDVIFGNGGDDYVSAGGGEDVIIDTQGADTLVGGNDDDVIFASGVVDEDAFEDAMVNLPANGSQADIARALSNALDFDTDHDSDSEGDMLIGGNGDDFFLAGEDDTISGGAGEDTIVSGDWITPGAPLVVQDFEPGEDQIVLEVEDLFTANVQVVSSDSGGPTSDAQIMANGDVLVVLEGAGGLASLDDVLIVERE